MSYLGVQRNERSSQSGTAGGHPEWFELEPDGPHERSGGFNIKRDGYIFLCKKDGQEWPCQDAPDEDHDARQRR